MNTQEPNDEALSKKVYTFQEAVTACINEGLKTIPADVVIKILAASQHDLLLSMIHNEVREVLASLGGELGDQIVKKLKPLDDG